MPNLLAYDRPIAQVSLKITPRQVAGIEALALNRGVNRSAITRELLSSALDAALDSGEWPVAV